MISKSSMLNVNFWRGTFDGLLGIKKAIPL